MITIKINAQQAALTPAAKIIFKDVKSKLTTEEKNFFSDGVYVQKQDKTRLTVDADGEDQGVMGVEIYPTDLNKDGIEEIFTRTSGTFFGQGLQDLNMYVKNKSGKYIVQEAVSSPRLYVHGPGVEGYPDLIGGQPEEPGFNHPVMKVDTYRWDGTNYKLYKKNQQPLRTDKSIDEVISPAYVKMLPANTAGNNVSPTRPGNGLATTPPANTSENTPLSPMAAMLFSNVKTKLTVAEKNDVAQKTGITAADTLAKTKKGKPKVVFIIYPTDLNNDGTEEVFLCVTTSALGIPIKNYYFYAKDQSGKYQPLPGKTGQGFKILLNGRSGYPDLINGVPGLTRELWSWDGRTYRLQQKIAGNANVPYKTKDIEKASGEYTGNL